MIEKGKSVLLFLLVIMSLYQSYLLAYSKPFMEAKVKTELSYVKTEPLGTELQAKDLIFPEQLVVHLGEDKHTVFYPSTVPYYNLILDKLRSREFKSLQRDSVNSVDWDQIARENQGIELRFGRAIPFELLQRVFKIDGDFLFYRDSIDRIWIYTSKLRDEVRTYFFSSDGRSVYEAQKADLTVGDVEGYVGFGQYWDPYTIYGEDLYIPEKPITRMLAMEASFDRYTTEQMQDNLFFDSSSARAIPNGTFYTDNKRSLKIEQEGNWLSYNDPVAPTEGADELVDNVIAAVGFVNQHGGWNSKHALVKGTDPVKDSANIRFQQYYRDIPVVSGAAMNFGYMQMTLQQGLVTSYARSLILMNQEVSNKTPRQLPAGSELRAVLKSVEATGGRIEALFPAFRPELKEDKIVLRPVWAARLASGEVVIAADSAAVEEKPPQS
ncbi:YycH family regulatory protein [Cohnella hongkongensis]|uniref:YycH family regulatory protein n=1 Tax=Cohnella hongkongensis TaxID=178337 RepID=A0ABV9FK07_9BACL